MSNPNDPPTPGPFEPPSSPPPGGWPTPPASSPPGGWPTPPASSPLGGWPAGPVFPIDDTVGPGSPSPTSPGERDNRWWVVLVAIGVPVLLVLLWMIFQIGSSVGGPEEAAEESDATAPSLPPLDDDGAEGSDDGFPGGSGGFPLDLPLSPDSIAVADDTVWVTDSSCGVLVHIDRETGEIGGAVDLGGSTSGVAVAGGSVWVGDRLLARVVRLDPETMSIEDEILLDGVTLGFGANETEVWAADPDGSAYQFDAGTGELLTTTVTGLLAHDVTVGDGAAWVTNTGDDSVTRIDRTGTAEPETFPVGAGPLHAAIGAGSLWVTNSVDGTVSRLDGSTGEPLATIEVGPRPHAIGFAGGAVWVGTESNELWRIEPADDTVELVEGATFSSIDLAVADAELWAADAVAGSVVHFDTETATIETTIDLAELGTCEQVRGEAGTPSPEAVSYSDRARTGRGRSW